MASSQKATLFGSGRPYGYTVRQPRWVFDGLRIDFWRGRRLLGFAQRITVSLDLGVQPRFLGVRSERWLGNDRAVRLEIAYLDPGNSVDPDVTLEIFHDFTTDQAYSCRTGGECLLWTPDGRWRKVSRKELEASTAF